MAQWPPPSVR